MSVRLLPLFPLPVVLFPGTPLPLHIFEPRYRRLLADCMESDREFGIVRRPEDASEDDIPAGSVGCVAHLTSVSPLPDGRANVIVSGGERFRVLRLADSPERPYHVGEVEPFTDVAEQPEVLDDLGSRLRHVFERAGRAARTLADEPVTLPELPEEPPALSFAVAAMIDLDLDTRQELLASRSPVQRLRTLETLLQDALPGLEDRARVHVRARGNGAGPGAAAP